jgi:SDR family mycofactocin-dependent oxidoreductase
MGVNRKLLARILFTKRCIHVGKLDGKVAFITGAARGQGRSHALRLAEEGADIIAIDIASQIGVVPYPMATPEDLAETVRQVEALDRRIFAQQADVRELDEVRAAVAAGIAELGPIDIVAANAGISSMFVHEPYDDERSFRDVLDVNLVGVWHTVHAIAPAMIERGAGGAIVLTSSTQGLSGRGGDGRGGGTAYAAAKHGVVGLMRVFANWLSPHNIRVNTVHPTGVNSPMLDNDHAREWFEMNPGAASMAANLMPVDLIEPRDISNAVAWLVSDEARYVTGITVPVDAGFLAK